MAAHSRVGKPKILVWLVVLLFVVAALALILRNGRSGCQPEFGQDYLSSSREAQGVSPVRGSIYDRNFEPLAVSFRLVSMFARPLALADPDLAASDLAPLLGLNEEALRREFRSTRGFVWLASSITPELAQQVKGLGYGGIRLVDDFIRYYPKKTIGAHVIGFQQNEHGLAGLESEYDPVLRGEHNIRTGLDESKKEEAVSRNNPGDLILSIDIRSQKLLERKLGTILKDTIADQAMALLMDPQTGEILALVNLPSYDPNRFWEYDVDILENRIIAEGINPGELRRIFRLGAAIQAGITGVGFKNEERKPAMGEKVIIPRRSKEMRSLVPYGEEHAWSFVQPGMYASREITALANPRVSKLVLEELELKLGFNRDSTIDLPTKEGSREDGVESVLNFSLASREGETSAIHLLSAFSRLVSGQNDLNPHLVRTYCTDDTVPKTSSKKIGPSGKEQGQVGLHNELLDFFAESASKGPGGSIFFESLVEEEQRGTAGGEDIIEENTSVGALADQKKYQGILLGLAPFNDPQIAMLVVVDGAIFDPSKASIMRRELFSSVNLLLKWSQSDCEKPGLEEKAQLKKKIFASWQEEKKREKGSAVPVILRGENNMPDLKGMSLRKALQKLGDCDLAIRVTGAGRVVTQHPAAGSPLKGKECLLELQMDQ